MTNLLELSHELLHNIFTDVHPADLASLSSSCRTLHTYISGNRLLHKELYVQRYDAPATTNREDEPDWEAETHRLVRLERILESGNRDVKDAELAFVAEAMGRMIETADRDAGSSKNVRLLSEAFAEDWGEQNINAFLRSSSLFTTAGTDQQRPAATAALQQASAKLHALFGKCIDPVPNYRCSAHYSISPFFAVRSVELTSTADSDSPSANTRGQTRAFPAHTIARSRVYDLRNYSTDTLWGPFLPDRTQRVDWEKIEAIMLVLGFNLAKFTARSGGRFESLWSQPFVGATPNSYIAPPPPKNPRQSSDDTGHDAELTAIRSLQPSIDSLDPFGVSGTWLRIVCFLDYNDLYAFNFSSRIPPTEPREPIDTEEGIITLSETVRSLLPLTHLLISGVFSLGVAIRLIRIKLQVTRVVSPEDADEEEAEGEGDDEVGMDWRGFKGTRLPVVHFRGSSRSLHASWDPNANSRIRGTVRQTPEGEIRWTTFSIFHDEERWRSEGIQVGGIKSARGVLGSWFDKDFDQHGPAGPTAFWKVSDDLGEEGKGSGMPLAYF